MFLPSPHLSSELPALQVHKHTAPVAHACALKPHSSRAADLSTRSRQYAPAQPERTQPQSRLRAKCWHDAQYRDYIATTLSGCEEGERYTNTLKMLNLHHQSNNCVTGWGVGGRARARPRPVDMQGRCWARERAAGHTIHRYTQCESAGGAGWCRLRCRLG